MPPGGAGPDPHDLIWLEAAADMAYDYEELAQDDPDFDYNPAHYQLLLDFARGQKAGLKT